MPPVLVQPLAVAGLPAAALTAIIAERGGVTVADYMALCLTHPEHGYYRRRLAIGAAGDFVTAPEISQVFGEILGGWCVGVWQANGSWPAHRLVELGPGRGTLAADVLRTLKLRPACRDGVSLDLVEINTALIAEQQRSLEGLDRPLRWCPAFEPQAVPTIVLANEFLDALPVRQLVHGNGQWRGRLGVCRRGAGRTGQRA
jgi:NADH dehydrogenase [ubiquinone] 1 alpha subcomplex assembly factor 7